MFATGFRTLIYNQLAVLGIVYIYIFIMHKFYDIDRKSNLLVEISIYLLAGIFMSSTYLIATQSDFYTAIISPILFGGIVYYMSSIIALLVSHTIALVIVSLFGIGIVYSREKLIVILFSILIALVYDRIEENKKVKTTYIVGVPLFFTSILGYSGGILNVLKLLIVATVMLELVVVGGYKTVETLKLSKAYYNQCITDPLTGLFNRRRIEMLANEKEDVSIIIIDIDDFKTVNTAFGHEAGDMCLKGVADIIMECCGNEDIPLRFGGDEFMVICKGRTKQYTSKLAEKIRSDINEFSFLYNQCDIEITVSIGIKNFAKNIDIENIIREADCAMYCSKNTGKNTITAI